MSAAERRLAELGLVLPPTPLPAANYVPFKRHGELVHIAGQGPRRADGSGWHTGVVGRDLDVAAAYEHARQAGLQLLAVMKAAAGDLDRVEVIKVFGMVAATAEFGEHPEVINGCSDLLVAVLGDRGRHARSAIGVASLPRGISVEIEAVFAIDGHIYRAGDGER